MFIKLEKAHMSMIMTYLEQHQEETIYLMKPIEQFELDTSSGTWYGYLSGTTLMGLFYFSNKSTLMLHCMDNAVLRNLQLLKAIKHHKPKYVKGPMGMTEGIYTLICRAVIEVTESKSTLMRYALDQIGVEDVDGVRLITGDDKLIDELLSDLRFFVDVESHFKRQAKAVNDIVKEFRNLISQENYVLAVIDKEIIAQGFIEDETKTNGILAGVYVSPKQRGKRVGWLITAALTKQLIERHKMPYLFVKNNNTDARRLYEKMGYKALMQYATLTITY